MTRDNVVRWAPPALDAIAEPSPLDALIIETITAEPPPPPLQLPTPEEIQAIREAARPEGFEQGRAEGHALGQSEVRRLTAQIEGILDNFGRPLVKLEGEVVAALGEVEDDAVGDRGAEYRLTGSRCTNCSLDLVLIRPFEDVGGWAGCATRCSCTP